MLRSFGLWHDGTLNFLYGNPIGTSERRNELWANGCHSGSEENTFAGREEKGIEGIL